MLGCCQVLIFVSPFLSLYFGVYRLIFPRQGLVFVGVWLCIMVVVLMEFIGEFGWGLDQSCVFAYSLLVKGLIVVVGVIR